MTNARCYILPSDWPLAEVTLGEEESHHLLHVLRVKAGQKIDVFNGEGGTGLAAVETAGRSVITVRILERSEQKQPPVQFALIQALPREQKMDLIIQKATELGASEIVPVTTEHAVVHLKQDRSEGKLERWKKIALNAAKQCGTAWLPEISPAQTLPSFLATRNKFDALLVCALDETARPIREAIQAIKGQSPKSQSAVPNPPRPAGTPPEEGNYKGIPSFGGVVEGRGGSGQQAIKGQSVSSVGVLVGPEGDFSAAEMESIRAAGAVPVSLGGTVLRSETAAIYALSVLRYELL